MYNNIIIPILLTFFSTLGLVAFTYKTFKKKPLFIRTPNWKFNYKPVDWKLLDYSAAMTTSTILILFYLLLFQELGFNINQTLARIVIAGICISALSMAVLYFKLIDQYKKISTFLGVIATLTTIVLTVICSALADSEIEHLTGAEAGKFPIAQKALTLTAVAAAWAYIIFWINLAATIIVIAYLFFKTGPTNSNGLNFQDQHRRTPYHAFNMLAGVIFLSLTYSNGVIAVFEDLSARRTKDWLVKSSFHQPPERCGVKEKPMDSLIALIGDDKAVLATSSLTELYRFNIILCTEGYKSTPAY